MLTLEVKPAPQPNFGNVAYIAMIDGEIVGNGNTPQDAHTDGLRVLLNGYRQHHYSPADLVTVNGVTHHRALISASGGQQ
jgi:hypothetical protein